MKKVFLLILTIMTFVSTKAQNNLDILNLVETYVDASVPKTHFTHNSIMVNLGGCKIEYLTSISHDGQIREYLLPIHYPENLDSILSDNYFIEKRKKYDIIHFKSEEFMITSTNNCQFNDAFFIDSDSVYTITNKDIKKKYKDELEDLNKLEGMGNPNLAFTDFSFSIWVHPDFEILELTENSQEYSFKKENNFWEFKGENINDFTYTLKYKSKRLINSKKVEIDGEEIELLIYDDKKDDGDIVNIYVNNKLLLKEYKATKQAISLMLPFEDNICRIRVESVNEGKIPPNTAKVKVKSEKESIKLNITSTDKKDFLLTIFKK